LEQLKENVEKAMQPRPVLLRGRPTGEYCYDGNAANRALEAAGKALGLFRTAPEDPLRLARQRYERMTPEERFSEDRLLLAQALLVIEEYYYAEGK
jgi:hypothetical protein